MIKIIKNATIFPNYVADTILDIDTKTLQHLGITHIVFDLDNTLVRHGKNEVTQEYRAHIQQLVDSGFTVLLGTNTKREIDQLAAQLGVAAVQPHGLSYKPFSSFYNRVIKSTGTTPAHIAMVGDHVINDVFGANQAGLTTILVRALHSNPSLVYRWYMRSVLRHASRS